MSEAVIVDAVRTPVGRRGGALREWHPVDLLAETLTALVRRTGIDSHAVDDVIAGCVSQVGEQSLNVGRNAALAAGFPESVPGTTIDRQCGSSQQAIAFAAQGIAAGAYDAVIACGVEVMSRVPLGASFLNGPGERFGPRMEARYRGHLIEQGNSAELVARRWNLTREQLDAYSLESHRRAARATADGRFAGSMVSVGDFCRDEGIRSDTSMEKLAALKPAFRADGCITAGNSSQISDGAAAVLLCSRDFARRLGLRVRARVVASAVVGDDPVLMLTAPIPATAKVLDRAGLRLQDIDLVELNEAFASVVLAWQRETGADLERINVNGGAIAMGHPLGSTGARLATILVDELERRNGRYGLQLMCEGGGMANATVIERV
ncbi:MAG TPA: thiolase family protein [Candidatus Baltobacteraceae bacterium]|nr:thiolase family protein [Candidatus Baltobacteraceae bacterium]